MTKLGEAETPTPGVRFSALGVDFAGPAIDVRGLTASGGAGADTQIVIDYSRLAHLSRRFRPRRVRTLILDGDVALTVDFDAALGYVVATPGDGRFFVSADGAEVVCAPQGPSWEALLRGQVLPLVATLRGAEVFHASSVVHAGRAILLIAPSGGGKSSIALRLVFDGARLLADDATAVDSSLAAHPGAQIVNIRVAEVALITEPERSHLRSIGIEDERQRFLCASSSHARPLGAVVMLQRGVSQVGIKRLATADPYQLLASTFNLSVRTPVRLERQLDRCLRIALEVPIFVAPIVPTKAASDLAGEIMGVLANEW